VRVHCLALGGVDLTSPAGRMTMGVINAVAQFERDLLIERTQSGLKRAKAIGIAIGRPASLDEDQRSIGRGRKRVGHREAIWHKPSDRDAGEGRSGGSWIYA
jgi:putative DNA-invertase from lambdoid prophage Rac